MVNYIWITTSKEMFHRYKDAPSQVDFLKSIHRHLMKFKIYIEIFHNDRDIEFFMFKRFIESVLKDLPVDVDNRSCEMISDFIAGKIHERYDKRDIKIVVSEDGENGIEYNYAYNQNNYS